MALGRKLRADFKRTNPCGKFNHPAHQIHAKDGFRHAVFHLQARIHFQKVKLVFLGVIDKFHRSRRTILDTLHKTQSRFVQFPARFFGKIRSGSFLDDLLVAALHRAVAFAEDNRISFAIAKDLHFDMATALHILFDKKPRVLEVVLAEALDALVAFAEFPFVATDGHSDSATTRRTLQHNRIADLFCSRYRFLDALQKSRSRNERNSKFPGKFLAAMLQPKFRQLTCRRTDKGDSLPLQDFREFRVFAQKAVSRVNRFRTGLLDGSQDRIHVEIAFPCGGRTDPNGFIGHQDMRRAFIRIRIDGNRLDAHFP